MFINKYKHLIKMNKNKAVVYCIYNKNKDLYYIGSSRNIDLRFKAHKKKLNKNEHNHKIQPDWNNSSSDDWEFNILEDDIPLKSQFISEQYWIDTLDSFNNGYNCHPKAGSYIPKISYGRKGILEKRKEDVENMINEILSGQPYRKIAEKYNVSIGFLSKLRYLDKRLNDNYLKRKKLIKQRKEEKIEAKRIKERNIQSALDMLKYDYQIRYISEMTGLSIGKIHSLKKKCTSD